MANANGNDLLAFASIDEVLDDLNVGLASPPRLPMPRRPLPGGFLFSAWDRWDGSRKLARKYGGNAKDREALFLLASVGVTPSRARRLRRRCARWAERGRSERRRVDLPAMATAIMQGMRDAHELGVFNALHPGAILMRMGLVRPKSPRPLLSPASLKRLRAFFAP
jgi:hypothetical protein